ncbi:hypothetical protein GB931_21205 [Modestobacter sp. I12A-02628]|uniref:MFS transporter n=1 Tax=Goekera deserti TaxID=2497753 RepID=A0A7K3WHY1_9ACTN|nr:hypothetical protein [Goekera deserti]MPR00392.1 hypothetical protein [Goekera deserti]NDI50404.1 hypothetical protein [Goekera deserti]NEL55330.1 MFS transporter [Goekera deserti]
MRTTQQTGTRSPDAAALAQLIGRRRRRPVAQGLLAVVFLALAVAEGLTGAVWTAVAHVLLGAGAALVWWRHPVPQLRQVTVDALLVRRDRRTEQLPRSSVRDVQARHGRGGYGLEVTVDGAEPLWLPGTARTWSVAAAQARELRDWAGQPAG